MRQHYDNGADILTSISRSSLVSMVGPRESTRCHNSSSLDKVMMVMLKEKIMVKMAMVMAMIAMPILMTMAMAMALRCVQVPRTLAITMMTTMMVMTLSIMMIMI